MIRLACCSKILLGVTLILGPISARCGTFSADFNSGTPQKTKLFGHAVVSATGGVGNSGVLNLAPAQRNRQGSFVIDDLDAGRVVSSFNVSFKMRMGGGTGGDGLSFIFAPDAPDLPFGEDGAGSGFVISFDSLDNGGGEAPAIDVRSRGFLVTSKKLNPRTEDRFVDVVIQVDSDGTLDLHFDNKLIISNIHAYVPTRGRFAFGGRTRQLTDNHFIDDLKISTTLLNRPFIAAVSPNGFAVRPDLPVVVTVNNFLSAVDPASVELKFNGAATTPAVTKEGDSTRISFSPATILPPRSTNVVQLALRDDSTPAVKISLDYAFVVENYMTLPADFALDSTVVDVSRSGFEVRSVQATAIPILPPTIGRAEAQLAGTLTNVTTGLPYADESAGSGASRVVFENLINYEQETNPTGNFTDFETRIPGIPGTGGHHDNFALEILTFLELSKGYTVLGVNSEDGFQLRAGRRDARDQFSLVVGQLNGIRTPADTLMPIFVEKEGIYSFRLLWYDSDGGASLEFFSINPEGAKVLINDRREPGSIRAFRALRTSAQTFPYAQLVQPAVGAAQVSSTPQISVTLQDGQVKVNPASIQLKLDGRAVVPVVKTQGASTTVSYSVTNVLAPASLHAVELSYANTAQPPATTVRTWSFTTAPKPVPSAQWDFAKGNLAATLGKDLEFGDGPNGKVAAATEFGSTESFKIPQINGKFARVMKFRRTSVTGPQPGFIVHHGISPNGGGEKVNQWTLILDLMLATPPDSAFNSLMQINSIDTDGDMFVRWNSVAGPGTGGLGVLGRYEGDLRTGVKQGQWHRIAIAADVAAEAPVISTYVDGVKFQDQFFLAPQLDGRFALDPTFRLFSDEDNEVGTLYVSSVQVIGSRLNDQQISALGGPQAIGIANELVTLPNPEQEPPPPVKPPTLTLLRLGNTFTLTWPAEYTGYTLESADNLSASSWTPVSNLTGNNATITLTTGLRFYRLRKPN